MKFAKTLGDLMVPEWQTKYVEYKLGKKRVRATTNHLRTAISSPAVQALRKTASVTHSGDQKNGAAKVRSRGLSILKRPGGLHSRSPNLSHLPNTDGGVNSIEPTALQHGERAPLQPGTEPQPPPHRKYPVDYGSSGTAPGFLQTHTGDDPRSPAKPPSLVLPGPMHPVPADGGHGSDAGESASTTSSSGFHSVHGILGSPDSRPFYTTANKAPQQNRSLLKRIFSLKRAPAAQQYEYPPTVVEVQVQAERKFLKWLLGELSKCDEFYGIREDEAVRRFEELREQLDIMRDRWFKAKHNIPFEDDDVEDIGDEHDNGSVSEGVDAIRPAQTGSPDGVKKRVGWKSLADAMSGLARPHPTSPIVDHAVADSRPDGLQDYERRAPVRKPLNNPLHRVAKRKLKKAYIEYYHGLEMLKSYVTVNRECFRKITKKFDKASGLRTSHRFMTEYVDKSHFGSADNQLDDLLGDTEALFARFFERGNRKEASSRLRSKENKSLYYSSVWWSGLYIGSTLIIGAYGLYNSILKLFDDDRVMAFRMSYLLQVWGGVCLLLLQALLFTINLRVWAKNKINYAFIFEFDTRHTLNYRQSLEFPALLSFIFAICFWFSAYDFWEGKLDMIYWPVIYVCITGAVMLNPFRMCYYNSRKWLLKTLWRVMFSGAYPVEFKDFWAGDMLCSQTYAIGNIELFFCLYAVSWGSPEQCNSSHSRLMGFFQALPAILRFFQCCRRYYNSGMWFPHLVNSGKYLFTILQFAVLSIWRIHPTNNSAKAAFIACASINSVYSTIWDIAMDWSLLDPYASRPFLRKRLGFKSAWPYYLALFINPIIRCDWFFYIIYGDQLQHSALLSFLIALMEVLRRFMWCFFRMENEHVGNVGANRAYRNLPLPYHFRMEAPSPTEEDMESSICSPSGGGVDLERMETSHQRTTRPAARPTPLVRTMTRVGRTMNQAHLQDYERRPARARSEEVDSSDEEADEGEDYYERTGGIVESPTLARRRASTAASC